MQLLRDHSTNFIILCHLQEVLRRLLLPRVQAHLRDGPEREAELPLRGMQDVHGRPEGELDTLLQVQRVLQHLIFFIT